MLRRQPCEQENIVSGALGAFDTRTGFGHKRSILFREGSVGEFQQNVMLDPLLQMADRQ